MKKYLALVLAVIMVVAAFAGCGKKDDEKAGPVDGGTFRNYFTSSPETLNLLATQATNPWVIIDLTTCSLYTTLMGEDKNSWYYGCQFAAELPKQVDTEGYVWEYKIREDLEWTNGDKITVDDWEFTFKEHANPLMQNLSASSMTKSGYGVLVNIYEYQMGEVTDWADVGYKKIDDYTFQCTFDRAITQYDAINACNRSLVCKSVYEKGLTEDKTSTLYGTDIENFACCGPYELVEWIPDAKFVLEKNDKYCHADWYHLDKIEFTVVPDSSTALQLFQKNELDYASVSYSMWESFEEDPRLYEYFNDSLMYMFVNWGNPRGNNMLGNLNFRQALYFAADRNAIAETLGVYPASRLVRKAVLANPVTGQAFVDIPADYVPDPYTLLDVTKANQKIDKAFEECKQTSFELRILTGDTANAATSHIRAACEMLQKQYDTAFAGKMTTVFQVVPSNQTTQLRRYNPDDPGAFDTAVGSLLPSAKDPRATFNFYQSTYSPPRFCYGDPQFDAWYLEAMSYDLQKDNDKIVELCQKMEKKLLDELAVVPFYETPTKVVFAEGFNLPAGKYITGLGFDTYKGWFSAK